MGRTKMKTANSVADWLRGLDKLNVVPVEVIINKKTYYGARYKQKEVYTAGMTVVRDGRQKEGDVYYSDHFYLVGDRPKKFGGRAKFCFPFGNFEWYIACYGDKGDVNEFHPFGNAFILMPWDVPNGSKIDTHERWTYKRVPIQVKELAEEKS
jgi:hypothetical protein